jgi:hypothetical protein
MYWSFLRNTSRPACRSHPSLGLFSATYKTINPRPRQPPPQLPTTHRKATTWKPSLTPDYKERLPSVWFPPPILCPRAHAPSPGTAVRPPSRRHPLRPRRPHPPSTLTATPWTSANPSLLSRSSAACGAPRCRRLPPQMTSRRAAWSASARASTTANDARSSSATRETAKAAPPFSLGAGTSKRRPFFF